MVVAVKGTAIPAIAFLPILIVLAKTNFDPCQYIHPFECIIYIAGNAGKRPVDMDRDGSLRRANQSTRPANILVRGNRVSRRVFVVLKF